MTMSADVLWIGLYFKRLKKQYTVGLYRRRRRILQRAEI